MKQIFSVILIIILLFGIALSEEPSWACPNCGRKGLTGKFCGTCGTSKPEVTTDIWTCPNCGLEGNTGNFCPECAAPRPVIALDDGKWICPACGFADNMGKFCTECATPRPAESRQTNGAKLPEPVEGVNCRLCNHSLVIKG